MPQHTLGQSEETHKPLQHVYLHLVPVLLVHGRKPPPYVLSADAPAGEEQRGSFANAAGQFGMGIRIPSDAELRAWGASVGHFPSEPPPASAGGAIVVGTLDWSETLPGWIGNWRMRWQGADPRWGISGVNYDAAFRNIVRGVVLAALGAGPPDQGRQVAGVASRRWRRS